MTTEDGGDRGWSPDLYMKFERERTRAARDLLAAVPLAGAALAFDLGCGPGNGVELLLKRFPGAKVVGLDTSEAMLAHARRRAPLADFAPQDIETWTPDEPVDLIFANAALHFLPRHELLFPRLASFLKPGGCLAVQMPSIVHEASHAAIRLVASEGPWSARLAPVARTQPVIASFQDYHAWLSPFCGEIDIWETTYIHLLKGPDDIVDWFAGSGLRPFLNLLDATERREFLARYRRELTYSYPERADGRTFFAYPRLFLVAVRSGPDAVRPHDVA
jgi:trans-aconitate 2-methyltransferase